MSEKSNCLKCINHSSQRAAKLYCTHYMINDDCTCSRDFELFPKGWGIDKLQDFDGIKNANENCMFENSSSDSLFEMQEIPC